MTTLIPMSDLLQQNGNNIDTTVEHVIGHHAYGSGGDRVGTVRDVLAEPGGKLRYFVVDAGSWFSSKQVLIPVGLGRAEEDGVYFDTLTKTQVNDIGSYSADQAYPDEAHVSDIRTLRGTGYVAPVATDTAVSAADHYQDETLFKTPTRLQLLEERLSVNKEKYQAGSVQVGKKVETRTENIDVALSHDEVVIERHPVADARPVEGNVTLGAANQRINVDLEAERANVSKQAYVTEEVEVGKRTETEQKTFSDTVGHEVLDVTKTGDVQVEGDIKGKKR